MKPRSGYVKGQIAVVVTFAIATLLGAMALGTDVAVMYFNWVQLQKAADAAALAGANYLGPNPQAFASSEVDASCTTQGDDPKKAACTYAIKNGMQFGEITLTEPNPSKPAPNIEVSLNRNNLPYFFGKVIGLSTYSVAASATAQSNGPVGTVYRGLFPAGVQCNLTCPAGCTCTTDSNGCMWSTSVSGSCTNLPIKGGSSVTFSSDQIWEGTQGSSQYSAGNWGWLNLPVSAGCTASGGPLAQAIACGASVSESITSVITKPGQTVGQIDKGWNQLVADHNTFVSNNPSCNILYSSICGGTSLPCPDDPLAVVVPMVNYSAGCNGACSIPISGFAQIYLDPTQTCMNPGSKKSTGCPSDGNAQMESCFLKTMARDTVGSSGAPNVGATSAPILIQ